MKLFSGVLQFMFGCRNRHLSRTFTIKHRTYRVCFDCAREFDLPEVHTPGRSSAAGNTPLAKEYRYTLGSFRAEVVPYALIETSELSCSDAPLDACHYRYS